MEEKFTFAWFKGEFLTHCEGVTFITVGTCLVKVHRGKLEDDGVIADPRVRINGRILIISGSLATKTLFSPSTPGVWLQGRAHWSFLRGLNIGEKQLNVDYRSSLKKGKPSFSKDELVSFVLKWEDSCFKVVKLEPYYCT